METAVTMLRKIYTQDNSQIDTFENNWNGKNAFEQIGLMFYFTKFGESR